MKLPENIKALMGMKHEDRFLMSATEARSVSLYGSKGDRDKYVIDLLEDYSTKIKEAAWSGKFSIVERFKEPDYSGVLQEIVNHFRSVGYGVRLVDNNDLPELYDERFIVIAWKQQGQE